MAAPPPRIMTKAELRKIFRARRDTWFATLSPEEIAAALKAAQVNIENALNIPQTVAGYAAMTSEFDPRPMMAAWREKGARIALPYFASRTHAMEFRMAQGALADGPFGGAFAIPQPSADDPVAEPDLILVPLLAADPSGVRLGQGGGHYDRMLSRLRSEREITAVGCAWECQIAETLPADPWDERLDFIATPERLIEVAR